MHCPKPIKPSRLKNKIAVYFTNCKLQLKFQISVQIAKVYYKACPP